MSSSQPDHPALWYADKVRTYGFDHRGLGFRNKSSQDKRFEAMLGLGDMDGARVLDVGCGFGDFLAFLNARGIEPEYVGLDSPVTLRVTANKLAPAPDGLRTVEPPRPDHPALNRFFVRADRK